jgi:phage-related minor tail protein
VLAFEFKLGALLAPVAPQLLNCARKLAAGKTAFKLTKGASSFVGPTIGILVLQAALACALQAIELILDELTTGVHGVTAIALALGALALQDFDAFAAVEISALCAVHRILNNFVAGLA